MMGSTNIIAQGKYRTKKPIRIDSLYCYDRQDVISIIHNEVRADQCDSNEVSYEKEIHLYKETITARDSQLVVKNRIITAKDFIISAKDEQLGIRESQNKILKKDLFKTKLKAWTIPIGTSVVVVTIVTIILKFRLNLF